MPSVTHKVQFRNDSGSSPPAHEPPAPHSIEIVRDLMVSSDVVYIRNPELRAAAMAAPPGWWGGVSLLIDGEEAELLDIKDSTVLSWGTLVRWAEGDEFESFAESVERLLTPAPRGWLEGGAL